MPEEVNRIVTDALADMLLTPSADADENLKREGVAKNKIRCVGNIMIDSLLTHLTQVDQSSILQRYGLRDGHFAYVTLHRPSNVDNQESLEPIIKELSALSHAWNIVFPAHPRTLKRIEDFNLRHLIGDRIKLIEPIGYIDSLALTKNARFVLTDSGGLQEESTYFRTPCLTLRPNTERPVTVTNGSNRLTTVDDLPRHINEVLQGPVRLGQIPPLWDGRTAERILSELAAG
jgi:UDP-N-acetylglucosamine 2-epimerase (non-hydrolysing)